MLNAYPRLFEPVNIGRVTIKNRIAMAPMGIVGLTDPDGNPSQRAIDYYIERARGGAGLIITGVFKVESEVEANVNNMHVINQASVGPFSELAEAVHALGAKIFVQLTGGFGRVAPMRILRTHPVSASPVPNYHHPDIICRPLEIAEIEKIVKAFGNAAAILASSDIDGIELHGHEGYLLDQFTTAIWNQRTDKYGGNAVKRLAFPLEVLREIKNRTAKDFPVQYRFGLKHYIKELRVGALPGEDYIEAGRDVGEGIEMAKLLEKAGFDSLHVDAGCYDSWYWAHPPVYQKHGCMADMAAQVKKVVNIPVMAAGRLEVPQLAENIISQGKADMVAVGRGLLADAYWPVKVLTGRTEDIRPCIGCHDGCIGRFLRGRPLSCAVNPACGREISYKLDHTETVRKVLVAGGGAAGMEAARVAAVRGHKVTLYEKRASLGGHLIEASVPDFKKDLVALTDWYKKQLCDLGVDVQLGTEATENLIAGNQPDIVILATGSSPVMPHIPGLELSNAVTCTQVLSGEKETGKRVSVIGGGLVGCETALWLAQQGKQVNILEKLPELMSGSLPVPHMNRVMLLDLLVLNHVKIFTGVNITEITGDGFITTGENKNTQIRAGTIVIAAGLKSDDSLYRSLIGKIPQIYNIGDSQQPRNIMGAIWDGYEVGRAI